MYQLQSVLLESCNAEATVVVRTAPMGWTAVSGAIVVMLMAATLWVASVAATQDGPVSAASSQIKRSSKFIC